MNPFREWIAKAGLTQHDVAKAWGVQDSAIWKITRNGHRLNREVAVRIWKFTGGEVTLDQLLANGAVASESRERAVALKVIRAAERRRKRELMNAKKKKKRKPRAEASRAEQRP